MTLFSLIYISNITFELFYIIKKTNIDCPSSNFNFSNSSNMDL